MSVKSLVPIPNILEGILLAFLAIVGVYVTYQIIEPILALFRVGMMRTVAILIMWLIYFFVLWVFVWAKFFAPKTEEGGA